MAVIGEILSHLLVSNVIAINEKLCPSIVNNKVADY